jgi:predicted phosphodiesterase
MKILVFSDTHLTDKFDKELYDYIAKLVKSADQVIINGDFWDAYLTTFNKFLESDWKKLFPLLKKKNTIYIFGNHDKEKFMDSRYNLFSDIQDTYHEFKSGEREFYITHGHLIVPTYDSFFLFKNPSFVRYMYRLFIFLVSRFIVLTKLFVFFEHKKNIQQLQRMKQFTDSKHTNQFFIFGHSHIPDLRISEHFISLGKLQSDVKHHCMIEDGYVDLIHKESKGND